MRFAFLTARYARIAPNKSHITLPLTLMAALYWLSSLPGIPRPNNPAVFSLFYWLSPLVQNGLHVPAYAIVAWSWHWALAAWAHTTRARAICGAVITSLFGISDEWHQSFVPGRFASLADVALDFAGTALGIWLAAYTHRILSASQASVGETRFPK